MNDIMMTSFNQNSGNLTAVYKNQFKNWNLKDEISLNPQQIDSVPISKISKLKIYQEQPVESRYLVKLQENKSNGQILTHLYAFSLNDLGMIFQKIFTYKLKSLGVQIGKSQKKFMGQIQGKCLKKSQIRRQWEERFLRISKQNGLTSKKLQKQKQSLHIKNTKQIWTRFQLIQNQQYIVIKVKYLLLAKEQFAVPIRQAVEWLKAFYSLFSA